MDALVWVMVWAAVVGTIWLAFHVGQYILRELDLLD